jgi:hypothetical protein
MPKAPSTCSQAPCVRQISATRARSSKSVVLTVPALATTIFGPGPAVARSQSRSAGSIASRSGRVAIARTRSRPRPVKPITLMKEACGVALKTLRVDTPSQPVSAGLTPSASPAHCRATTKDRKFDAVAPVVKQPSNSRRGRPKRSKIQPRA